MNTGFLSNICNRGLVESVGGKQKFCRFNYGFLFFVNQLKVTSKMI